MIDKIKQYLVAIIGTIGVILVAAIYYLVGKNKNLQSQVGQAKAEKDLADVITKKEEAANAANASESEYNRIRDEYNKSNGGDSSKP